MTSATECCGICLEDRIPGPPLCAQVFEFNQIFDWVPVCSDCRNLCISRTQVAYCKVIDEILTLLTMLKDADTNNNDDAWFHQYCEFLLLTLADIQSW